jgi:hypothetical protein
VNFERQMKEGSGYGAFLIELIWAPIFLDPVYVRSQMRGNLEVP